MSDADQAPEGRDQGQSGVLVKLVNLAERVARVEARVEAVTTDQERRLTGVESSVKILVTDMEGVSGQADRLEKDVSQMRTDISRILSSNQDILDQLKTATPLLIELKDMVADRETERQNHLAERRLAAKREHVFKQVWRVVAGGGAGLGVLAGYVVAVQNLRPLYVLARSYTAVAWGAGVVIVVAAVIVGAWTFHLLPGG